MNALIIATIVAAELFPQQPKFSLFTSDVYASAKTSGHTLTETVSKLKAVYDSAAGRVESAWEYDAAGKVSYRFVVPEGTTATLMLPGRSEETIAPGTHIR